MDTASSAAAPADEIHFWLRSISSGSAESTLLSPAEAERAERIASAEKRAQFIAGRALARRVLGETLGIEPGGVPIVRADTGRPSLAGDTRLEFSVSHSGGLVMLGVARGIRFAVDIEKIQRSPSFASLALRSYSQEERDLLAATPEPERRRFFYDIWTCKEAYMKANGRGIFSRMHAVSVDPGAGRVVRGLDGESAETWRLAKLEVPSTHRASVCWESASGDALRFRVHDERG